MQPTLFWKNFNLGGELNIAGSFLYNSIFHLSGMRNFHRDYECFEVLYNASVAIERLQKISIILLAHNDSVDQEEFEKNLITHDHVKLMQRIKGFLKIKLAPDHNNLLTLLKDFYKINRYDRYRLSSISNTSDERFLLTNFIGTGLKISINYEGAFPDTITDKMRRYFGKALIKVSDLLFTTIKESADKLGIFTTEMESNSKAYRIFLQKEVSFENELNFKREILIFLIANAATDRTINYLKQIDPLYLDGSTAEYIEFLLNNTKDPSMVDELHTRYEDMSAKERKKRTVIVELIGENLAYINPDEETENDYT